MSKRKIYYTKELLIEIVDSSRSFNQVATQLKLLSGGARKYLVRDIKEWDISTEHFTGVHWSKGRILPFSQANIRPIEDYLNNKYQIRSQDLKKRLVKEGYLKDECLWCSLTKEWNGKPIVLQLDHIDGDHSNNKLINLRILCPNCHTQTDTFCSTMSRKRKSLQRKQQQARNSLEWQLIKKQDKPETRKVERPSKEELEKLVWEKPSTLLAKMFGVSDKSIEKWCKRYGITKPGPGYWQKLTRGGRDKIFV